MSRKKRLNWGGNIEAQRQADAAYRELCRKNAEKAGQAKHRRKKRGKAQARFKGPCLPDGTPIPYWVPHRSRWGAPKSVANAIAVDDRKEVAAKA